MLLVWNGTVHANTHANTFDNSLEIVYSPTVVSCWEGHEKQVPQGVSEIDL